MGDSFRGYLENRAIEELQDIYDDEYKRISKEIENILNAVMGNVDEATRKTLQKLQETYTAKEAHICVLFYLGGLKKIYLR